MGFITQNVSVRQLILKNQKLKQVFSDTKLFAVVGKGQ
jgi:hypothetical protein